MDRNLTEGEHFADINGVRLRYVIAGEGPALFATSPGWGIGIPYLMNMLRRLQAYFRIVYIEARGSGKSGRPSDIGQMDTASMARDIDGLRQFLGIETIDLLGHSNGGAIALEYALQHGEHLRRLILVSSQLIGFNASEAVNAFLRNAESDPRYRDGAEQLKSPRPTDDEAFTDYFIRTLPLYFHRPDEHVPAFVRAMGRPLSAWAYHAQAMAIRERGEDQSTRLDGIKARTLILVGRHCWVCPVEVSEHIHAGIPGSRLSIFSSSGHFPCIEEPEVFFPEVVSFLQEHT